MRILFCNNLLQPRKVDPDFMGEWRAAKEAGLEISLLSYESLLEGDMNECLRRIQHTKPEQLAVYRGWMLRPEQYTILYTSLLSYGIRLLNSPEAYTHCHYLPNSFNKIASVSPKTIWLPLSETTTDGEIMALLDHFGQSAVVVKDYVKSEKHYWKEACFIPNASDREHALKVVQRFMELRGNELNEGLVIRKFEELDFLTNHSQSQMPVTREFRMFFLKEKLMGLYPYWNEADYGEELPDTTSFEALAKHIESDFFTMDVAQKKSGEWIIMELGDGQVSGIPDERHTSFFYEALHAGYSITN